MSVVVVCIYIARRVQIARDPERSNAEMSKFHKPMNSIYARNCVRSGVIIQLILISCARFLIRSSNAFS